MRDARHEVYARIKQDSLLGSFHFTIYEILYIYGPLTSNELARLLPEDCRSKTSPRFAELLHLGCVAEIGRRICSVTGCRAMAWDVTSSLPLTKQRRHRRRQDDPAIYEQRDRLLSLLVFSVDDLTKQVSEGRRLNSEESTWLSLARQEIEKR